MHTSAPLLPEPGCGKRPAAAIRTQESPCCFLGAIRNHTVAWQTSLNTALLRLKGSRIHTSALSCYHHAQHGTAERSGLLRRSVGAQCRTCSFPSLSIWLCLGRPANCNRSATDLTGLQQRNEGSALPAGGFSSLRPFADMKPPLRRLDIRGLRLMTEISSRQSPVHVLGSRIPSTTVWWGLLQGCSWNGSAKLRL